MTDLFPLHEIVDQAEPDSWTPTNLNTLPDKPPIKPTLGSTGLLYPGKRHVFSGPPDSAKTIAAYCVLIAVVRTGAMCALIDFEMGGYDARQRLLELGATRDELNSVLYVEPAERATPERIDVLVAHEPALVVVDAAAGAYDIQGLDDDKRKDVEALTGLYVKRFWRNGIATLFIDHVVKNAEARGRFMIGSERKLGGVDVHYGFDTIQPVSRGTTGHYKLIIHRDRGGYLKRGHLANLHLDSDADTHDIAWKFATPELDVTEDGYFRPTHLMEKVSIQLELQGDPTTRNQIAQAVSGSKEHVLKAIVALVSEGFATEEDGPNRSKLVRSSRRYREDDPLCNPEKPSGGSVVLCGSTSGSEPPGGSVVPGGSDGGSEPECVGGSPHPFRGVAPEPLTETGTHGWFGDNGRLADTDLAWLDELTPDHDPDADPNP